MTARPRHMIDPFKVTLSVTTFNGTPINQHEGIDLKEATTLSGIYLRNGVKVGNKIYPPGEVIVRIFAEK